MGILNWSHSNEHFSSFTKTFVCPQWRRSSVIQSEQLKDAVQRNWDGVSRREGLRTYWPVVSHDTIALQSLTGWPPPPEPFRHQYVLTYTTSYTKILCFLAQIVENNQKVIYVLDRKEQKRSLLSFKTITVLIFLICHVWSYHKPYLVVTATLFINELWPDPWCSWPSGTDDMLYVQTGQRCQSLGSVTSAGSHSVTITALNRWK